MEIHGKGDAYSLLHPQNPYKDSILSSMVLSCTDCHEPHGSPNVFLLRKEVNGAVLDNPITAFSLNLCSFPPTDENKVLGWLCKRCHKDGHDRNPGIYTEVNTWKESHHYYIAENPYMRTRCGTCHPNQVTWSITCNCCHYHGSHTTDYGADYPCSDDPGVCYEPYDRRTF